MWHLFCETWATYGNIGLCSIALTYFIMRSDITIHYKGSSDKDTEDT